MKCENGIEHVKDYYSKKLSSERLRRVYELAPTRVRRYLETEIQFVMERITPGALVLELGCGYGRVLERLLTKTEKVVGIDTSTDSLVMAYEPDGGCSSAMLLAMDAAELGFRNKCFDLVACIQNGISAFKVDQEKLMREALRVTRSKGRVLFSSYSERFWPDRLEWFRIQADHGLLGEIDEEATGNGVIVCKDGFKATTIGPDDFQALISRIGVTAKIVEVDCSSIFCDIVVP
jgi:2-polyprenyl-6-hydroxyphenyl methylase/3-demethylubiquinone-9 3-methyltransferase